jgi:hypothetical protein
MATTLADTAATTRALLAFLLEDLALPRCC